MDKNAWDAITAVSTAAAAIFTAVMAWFTRKAIREGQGQRQESNDHFAKARDQDKQHHEDTFRPLLILTPSNIMDTLVERNLLLPDPNHKTILVNCAARNIGTGAALNVRLSVRSEGRIGFGPTRELTPMSAGGMLKNENGNILIDVPSDNPTFNEQDLSNLPHGHWIVVLEYEDVFGNPFYTLHARNPALPWTRVGRGSPPDTTPHYHYSAAFPSPAAFKEAGGDHGFLL